MTRERTGLISISLHFIFEGPSQAGGAEPFEEMLSYAPAAPLNLIEVGRTASKQTDGSWLLQIVYEGITSDSATGALLEYDNSSVEDPIESYEKFNDLLAKYDSKDRYNDETGEFSGFKRLITPPGGGAKTLSPIFGQTHFLNNQPILRVTFLLKEFKTELLKNICKIDTPQVPKGTASVVDTPEGKSWLKRCVKARFRGNVWEIELEYLLGKWNPDIYNARA